MATSSLYSFTETGPGLSSQQYSYILFVTGSNIFLIGVITAAVPQAPTSSKDSNSSTPTGLFSTFIPIFFANSIRLILVMEGRIEVDFGVIYVLFLIAKKFAGPHSSMYFFSFASRYKVVP